MRDFTDGLAPASTLGRVQQVWDRTAGSAIALAARPTAERNGVLTVTCEASVWAQELDLISEELVASLNAALGAAAIRELRCRTG
jgi:predicted nucleic acid-binding Zn ribbon protein